jgi:DNA replication licensing factor MCM4
MQPSSHQSKTANHQESFKTYIDVLHIQKVDKRRLGIDVSTIEQDLSEQIAGDVEETRKVGEEEEQKIKDTAARSDVYELLSRSLALASTRWMM